MTKPYSWEARKGGLVVRAECVLQEEFPLASLDGLAPYEFCAKPFDPNGKSYRVNIEYDHEPVWLFGTNHAVEIFGRGETITTALFFGRRNVDTGREEVALIFPDGAAVYNGLSEARVAFFERIASAQQRR